MLQPVAVGNKTLADYTHICGRELIEEIRALAEPLKGHRVVHVSATAFGGGVSEILYTLVPLMRDVGLDCEWQVIYGREEFFNATKLMHNALQGAPLDLDEEQWQTWHRYNEMNARELSGGMGRVPRARPAAGGAVQARPGEGGGMGVALSHRPLHPQRARPSGACSPTSRTIPRRCSTCATTSPRGCTGG